MLDDDFMSKVFEDSECAEILLKIILNRDDLKVQDVHVQHVIHNLQGRSIRLDIYAVDLEGKSDETTLGRLMHDFWCTDAGDMYNTVLANRVRYFKEDVKGVEIMCKEMEKMRDETRKELIVESIRKMLKARITEEQIKQVYDVTDEEIEQIKEKMNDD